MSAPLYIGLDGGGTKTASVILDSDHRELGRGQGGPCNIATCDDDTLYESVTAAARTAMESADLPTDAQFAGVCAGVAGFVVKSRRAEFARHLAVWVPAEKHRVEPDFVIAYWGATEGEPGVVVIAGTGAVAYGRNAEGQEARADGRGFLLGDRGSGFDIGLQALKQVLKVLDARERKSRSLPAGLLDFSRSSGFADHIMGAIGAEDPGDVVEWAHRPLDPARIAGLATAVGELAAAGDEMAAALLELAALRLRSTASRVANLLGMGTDTPIYPLGGLWRIGAPLLEPFRLGKGVPVAHGPLVLRDARHDAAYGAALLASRGSGA